MKDKEAQLEDILKELARLICDDDDPRIMQYIEKLQSIYSDGFRHNYSQFFRIVTELYENANNAESNTSLLLENLTNIKRNVDMMYGQNDNFRKSIDKLWDHVNLEISRCDYTRTSTKIDSVAYKIEQIEKKMEKALETARKNTEDAQERIARIQSEFVGILGIFATVVMVFSGSFTLLGGSFSQISETSLNRLVIMTSIVGVILFNTVFILLYIISKMIGRNIYSHCKSTYCHECDGNCNIINRLKKRFPYMFWLNVILLFMFSVGIFYNSIDSFIYFFRFIANLFLTVVTFIKTCVSCLFHCF